MIYILFVLLFILLCVSLKLNDKDIVAPSVIFVLSFVYSSFWAVIYSKRWELGLHFNTFFVIFFGAVIFIVTSYLANWLVRKNKSRECECGQIEVIDIALIKKILFLIFAIVMTLLCLYFTVKSVGGDITNIRASLYKYRNYTAFKNINVTIPFIVSTSMGIIHCAAYWFLYVLINNYLKTRKIDITILMIVLVCGISNLIEGNRGGILNFTLSIVPIYIILKKTNEGKSYKISKKNLFICGIVAIMIIFGLQFSARMIGRDDVNSIDTMDYIAMYSGAEIKNLDILLQNNIKLSSLFGRNTFSTLLSQLSNIFKFELEKQTETGTFNSINGFNLGNVYTIYSSFILDFGYFGFVPMNFALAFVIQLLYEKCKNNKDNVPNIYILIYSFCFGGLVFSFFSNKLLNQTISFSFIEYIITWYLFNYFFVKLKIKIGNIKLG